MLDETISGETMALSFINKINNKLKFLYRKNRFLTPTLRQLSCNAFNSSSTFRLRLFYLVSQLNQKIENRNPDLYQQMYTVLPAVRKDDTYIS